MSDPRPVLIAVGSNIEPRLHLPRALTRLRRALEVTGLSRVYESEPFGGHQAPPFLNAAVAIETELGPFRLKFGVLRVIEAELGRVRVADRSAPRTLDLDLVLYGDLVVEAPEAGLELPDPDILRAAHLARPLADLAPSLHHPTSGERLDEIARRLASRQGLRVVEIEGWSPGAATEATEGADP